MSSDINENAVKIRISDSQGNVWKRDSEGVIRLNTGTEIEWTVLNNSIVVNSENGFVGLAAAGDRDYLKHAGFRLVVGDTTYADEFYKSNACWRWFGDRFAASDAYALHNPYPTGENWTSTADGMFVTYQSNTDEFLISDQSESGDPFVVTIIGNDTGVEKPDPSFIFRDQNHFIKVENIVNGIISFFNKKSLFIQYNGNTGFIVRNDDYLVSYEFANIAYPSFETNQEFIDTLVSWVDERDDVLTEDIFDANGSHIVLDVSAFPPSSIFRDRIITSGDGKVEKNASEPHYLMEISPSGGSASLFTSERGRYVTGAHSQADVAVRFAPGSSLPDIRGSNKRAFFGYFDDQNGFYFLVDGDGMGVGVRKNGTDTRIDRRDWNIDPLNGGGPSGVNLDLTRSHVYGVRYEWFGSGSIRFQVLVSDSRSEFFQTVHQYNRQSGSVNVANPNLPITVRVENLNVSDPSKETPFVLFVSERRFALTGAADIIRNPKSARLTSVTRITKEIDKADGFVPLVSVRKKAGFADIPVRVMGLDLTADEECVFQVRVNSALSFADPVFENIEYVPPNETAIERDVTSGQMAGGIALYTGLIAGGSEGNGRASARVDPSELEYYLREDVSDVVTVGVYSFKANISTTTCVARFRELW